jgi:2-polyprenyl-6-methoxyphenol hydroxylase-like FAD-dependent oxidoreductase
MILWGERECSGSQIWLNANQAFRTLGVTVATNMIDRQTVKRAPLTVLISGASIAGPALALWLVRYGFAVTVVERAPGLRRGGQAVDFKGVTHRTVLERMGILDDVRQARTDNADGFIVDAKGRKVATVPAEFSGGEIEIARGELAQIIYQRTAQSCEYLFDDSVTALHETANGVDVTFERSPPRAFDLVVGADGIHSNVRRLAFGPEANYVRFLGYYYALAKLNCETSTAGLMYNEPGRMASTGGSKAPAFFVFASNVLEYERDDIEQQKRLLADVYRGGAWRIPELMEALPDAEEFYMDSVSRVTIERYSQGRIVLLGDSAYGNTLGGFGTGLAIVGAYVLAGELLRARGDYLTAYAQYESNVRGYAKVSQKVNAGVLLAPKTRIALYARNRLFSVAALFKSVIKLMDHFASDIVLDDYAIDA